MITNDFQALLYQKFIGMSSQYVVKQLAPEAFQAALEARLVHLMEKKLFYN